MKIRRERSKAVNFCLSGGVLLVQPSLIINVSSRAALESSYNLNTMQFDYKDMIIKFYFFFLKLKQVGKIGPEISIESTQTLDEG